MYSLFIFVTGDLQLICLTVGGAYNQGFGLVSFAAIGQIILQTTSRAITYTIIWIRQSIIDEMSCNAQSSFGILFVFLNFSDLQ